MARCRCSMEQCVCVLAAGPGAAVSGSGSPADPWVISTTGGGSGGGGVAPGGSPGQALIKASSTNYDTSWVTLTKDVIGLGNVDNTSDATKPISTATQTALDLKPDSTTVNTIVTLTQAAYDAIVTKDPATLYFIT